MAISITSLFLYACSHPIEIVGQGDVTSASGNRNCHLEDFQASRDNCSKNYAVAAYQETYYPTPRTGWKFDHWVNYCADATPPNYDCSFNVPAATVYPFWGQTMPPLKAVFTTCSAGNCAPALIAASIEGIGTVAGTVVVRVEPLGGFNPTSVRVSGNGGVLATDTNPPFELAINTAAIPNGPVALHVTGTAGATTSSTTLEVVVDNRTYDWAAVSNAMSGKLLLPTPGVSLRVAHHGAVIYDQSFGTFSPTTQVALASGSKWLSAAAIMTLVDDGLLNLDAPISTYLPEFSGDKAAITLRRLLSFTSGIQEDPSCVSNNTLTLAQCTSIIAASPLAAPVGAQYRYGSGHLVVAASAAEAVTGQSWSAIVSERLTAPLGLTNTRFTGGNNPNPAGSARSTLIDYDRFLRMLWNNGRIDGQQFLSEATVAEMQRDQTGGAPIVVASEIRKILGSRYGFGEWFDILNPTTGSYEVSSPGTFGFHPWIDRERDIYGVFVIDYRGTDLGGGGWDVKALVRNAIDNSD